MKWLAFSLLLSLATASFAADHALTVAVIGDSTVCEYPEESPSRGWGHFLPEYFQDDVKIVNLAASGRSTKTFIAEGRWANTLAEKPDYILIQFGHNDSHAPEKPEATNAATDYRDYLRQYIREARAAGARPILVTSMVRRTFHPDGTLNDTLVPYADAMKAVAAEESVPIVDLHASSAKLLLEQGEAKSAEFANAENDRTHFNEKGARAMAKLVMHELPMAVPALRPHLRSEVK